MTFFGQLFGSGGFSFIAILFTLLSLASFANAVRLAGELRRRWADFTTNPLQLWQKNRAEAAAFLIMVPPGVLLHELGHAVAVWFFGGRIIDVGYGFYWGYVVPSGSFSTGQDWFISLAGTLATLLYTVLFWLLLRRHEAEAVRFLARRSVRFHIFYALIYYPVFTLFTFIGDWRIIYNFNATPLLSGATLLVHAALLAGFWWTDRQGWYEMPAFASERARQAFGKLQEHVAERQEDEAVRVLLIHELLTQGDAAGAVKAARQLTVDMPHSAVAQQMLAAALSVGQRRVPRAARAAAQRALELGLKNPVGLAQIYDLLGRERLEWEQPYEALAFFDHAVAAANSINDANVNLHYHHIYFHRAQVRRRLGRYEGAAADLAAAKQRALTLRDAGALDMYDQEALALEKQRR